MNFLLIAIILLSATLFVVGLPRIVRAHEGTWMPKIVASAAARLTRASVQKKLQRLAKSPAPPEKTMGAMCYKPMAPHRRTEFICDKDGHHTRYPVQQGRKVGQIDTLRKMIKGISEIDLQVDASEFCEKCNPGVKEPEVWLVVQFPKSKKPHRVRGVDTEDIELITELLAGKLDHSTGGPDSEPLRKHLPRLQELLGIAL